jgi:hypothetical protein
MTGRLQLLVDCSRVLTGMPTALRRAFPIGPREMSAAQPGRVQESPELNANLLEIAETNVAMYDTYLLEMEKLAWAEANLQQHRRSFGSRAPFAC